MCQAELCKVWSILGEKGETSVMGQKGSRKTERRGRETTLSLDVVGRWNSQAREEREKEEGEAFLMITITSISSL